MDENVFVAAFTADGRAHEALARLRELAAESQIDFHERAVAERSEDGTLHLRGDAGNEDDGLATPTADTIGLRIGVLASPLGVLLGGAVGLRVGAIVDAEDDDETDSVLEYIWPSIGNGEKALLADVGESAPAPVDGAMAALDGRVTCHVARDLEADIAGSHEVGHEARAKAREELHHQRREATVEKVHAQLGGPRERLGHLVHP
jgi:uncharacterized membrane protein